MTLATPALTEVASGAADAYRRGVATNPSVLPLAST
jgi:hypothetical protein